MSHPPTPTPLIRCGKLCGLRNSTTFDRSWKSAKQFLFLPSHACMKRQCLCVGRQYIEWLIIQISVTVVHVKAMCMCYLAWSMTILSLLYYYRVISHMQFFSLVWQETYVHSLNIKTVFEVMLSCLNTGSKIIKIN